MLIRIDGNTISRQQLNAWKIKRIKKVLRSLKQKAPMVSNADTMNEELAAIKLQYTYDEMLVLLRTKLRISTLAIKCAIALSGNKRKFAVTEISMDGISADKISSEIDRLMLEQSRENDQVNLAACPDHYVLRPTGENALEVIETCGNSPLPFQFFIVYGDETGIQTPRDMSYKYQSAGIARTKNGKLMGGVRHQFKNTDKGVEAKLVVEYPALCPTTIVKAHQMHLACEFSYWFQWIKDNEAAKFK